MIVEGRFRAGSLEGFYERRWPVDAPRANVLIVHGYREHCARYDHVAATLNHHAFSVYSYDQRGHGRSPGKKSYIERFDHYLDDLDAYLAHAQPDFGGLPLLVIAHSMGGLVFTRYLQTRAFRPAAVVLSSPLLAMKEVSPILLSLADTLSALAPWLPVAGLDPKAISRVPSVVEEYQRDPLNGHGAIVARSGAELTRAVALARQEAAKIALPLYLMHGTADQLAPCEGSRYLHEHAASMDKTLKIYEGGYHELMNDVISEEVKQHMADWMESKIAQP